MAGGAGTLGHVDSGPGACGQVGLFVSGGQWGREKGNWEVDMRETHRRGGRRCFYDWEFSSFRDTWQHFHLGVPSVSFAYVSSLLFELAWESFCFFQLWLELKPTFLNVSCTHKCFICIIRRKLWREGPWARDQERGFSSSTTMNLCNLG